jgi:hypothetical protein
VSVGETPHNQYKGEKEIIMKIHAINMNDGYHLTYNSIEDFITDFNDGLVNSITINLYTEEQEKELNKIKKQIQKEK